MANVQRKFFSYYNVNHCHKPLGNKKICAYSSFCPEREDTW